MLGSENVPDKSVSTPVVDVIGIAGDYARSILTPVLQYQHAVVDATRYLCFRMSQDADDTTHRITYRACGEGLSTFRVTCLSPWNVSACSICTFES